MAHLKSVASVVRSSGAGRRRDGQSAEAPAASGRRAEAEAVLREMAFVFQAARTVRRAMTGAGVAAD